MFFSDPNPNPYGGKSYISLKKSGYLWIIVFPKWLFFFGKNLLVNLRNLTSKIPKMMGLGRDPG